ncbi:hypothetical protein TSOC_001397 [Tetrabaena socialis]|uniref:CHRD domain-containing protein n=1 Tax=Tetrabaena socialis TaxID=47790 RepID=A0A2J8AGR3_9CHLO|nr:hypothetical protein TSOC_001397 [Tetrabaena socialis]|eukprot:PNH11709.1 hypothetical protein TSOC_001397 [Tetrabaena socialis]
MIERGTARTYCSASSGSPVIPTCRTSPWLRSAASAGSVSFTIWWAAKTPKTGGDERSSAAYCTCSLASDSATLAVTRAAEKSKSAGRPGLTPKEPPRGDAPKPSTDNSSPVEPRGRRGSTAPPSDMAGDSELVGSGNFHPPAGSIVATGVFMPAWGVDSTTGGGIVQMYLANLYLADVYHTGGGPLRETIFGPFSEPITYSPEGPFYFQNNFAASTLLPNSSQTLYNALLADLRSNESYVIIHTVKYPRGEIWAPLVCVRPNCTSAG